MLRICRMDTLRTTEPPFVRGGYARMEFDRAAGVVLVPFGQRLMVVRDSDGKILWIRAAKFPSRLAQIEVTPHGYLVRGYFKDNKPSESVKPFVDLLDPATGQSRWPEPLLDLDKASVMTVQGDTAWLASRRRIVAVALPGEQTSQRGNFEFKGDELPAAIEENDGTFILLSAHNLVCVTPTGEVRFQHHYPPPGSSLLSKIASGALLVGTAALAGGYGYTPTYYSYQPKPVADPRYARALYAQRFVHILTGAKDSTGTKGFSVVPPGQDDGRRGGTNLGERPLARLSDRPCGRDALSVHG
jgi:hypothetical protein